MYDEKMECWTVKSSGLTLGASMYCYCSWSIFLFDYKFIKEEFARLGYTYTRKQLCTVRLSRQAFPGRRSYSLGNMIKFLKIKVENRHRAMDDAKAALICLQTVMQQQEADDIHPERRRFDHG